VPPKDIRVISPFTTVASRLRTEIRKEPRLRGVRAGTVHTTQGQEAPVVVLVLGGNPQSPNAKTFATAKPNLLNVALTRAQRRFYVVGERPDWIGLPQFQHLSTLPVWPVATQNGAPR
jgi:superfamily I DNA and/or RNA helicase